jgi:hypothetical protein
MHQILAIASEEAVTWGDVLVVLIGIVLVLAIIYLIRRT